MKGTETILPKTEISTTYDDHGNTITEVKEDYDTNKITITIPEYYLTGSTNKPTQKPQLPEGEYKIEIYQTNTATTALTETKINLIQMPFNLTFYHHDHLGTTRYITNENGEILHTTDTLAYGEELTAPYENDKDEVLNTITYTGHEKDYETDLTYMLARYYSQGYGRFLSPDPGYDYDQLDPMSWNLYSYVRGNPINFDDPSGMVVNVSGLNEDEQQKLISDLQKITGYKSIEVDKDGNLQIGANGEHEGGSKDARTLLNSFITSSKVVSVLSAETERKKVLNGAPGNRFTSNLVIFGRAEQGGNKIAIDFGDFAKLRYIDFKDDSKKLTMSVGMTFFHELLHAFFNYPDENKANREASAIGGCNVIREQLGLPERHGHASKPALIPRYFREIKHFNQNFIFDGGRQVIFKLREVTR